MSHRIALYSHLWRSPRVGKHDDEEDEVVVQTPRCLHVALGRLLVADTLGAQVVGLLQEVGARLGLQDSLSKLRLFDNWQYFLVFPSTNQI